MMRFVGRKDAAFASTRGRLGLLLLSLLGLAACAPEPSGGIRATSAESAVARSRATSAESAVARSRATPAEVFTLTCAHCHAGAAQGAPRAGVPADWNARATRDFDQLVAHAIGGHGSMPPLGSCSFCSEADLRAVIAMMVAGSEIKVPAALEAGDAGAER